MGRYKNRKYGVENTIKNSPQYSFSGAALSKNNNNVIIFGQSSDF
jgi:hypothetical protein